MTASIPVTFHPFVSSSAQLTQCAAQLRLVLEHIVSFFKGWYYECRCTICVMIITACFQYKAK